ncbi:endo-beta-N-acetylglucosaminidase [Williamsoniiplasma luminosum]|uniref:Cytosolic endo-beta-N-acetylglucosaminidase TIM barrel domain-containing protein n=1 Tax=Williamsoniiplasma luminosum TaxID=214888 RepID=A0A2S0NKP3_9MOLU|nr:hypothetical protein [Williamsoniiplasma luminosum]AVP49586.1 MAG: hypothetical protein C5T88_03355 [Williamsoniiplasma luminosum]
MKKTFPIFILSVLIFGITANFVVVNIGNTSIRRYLETLPDFDWSSGYGDRAPDIKIKPIELKNNHDVVDQNTIYADAWDSVFDYTNFHTGYQYVDSIKKQAVTGAPTGKLFQPNGNIGLDFGLTSRAIKFQELNSFLTWNPKNDMDAKYNVATIANAVTSKRVAAPWAASQNPKVLSKYLSDSNIQNRVPATTNIGLKNNFEISFANLQYTDYMVGWGGSWFEGLIKLPPADLVEESHKNGIKVFGNIFLDGYHGLSKKLLRDFLKKDSSGNYLIAQILINMAAYMNLDGWFWNNEANGGLPNGSILDYRELKIIFKQMNEIIKKSKDPKVQKLQNEYYANLNLQYNTAGRPYYQEAADMVRVSNLYQQTFGFDPYEMKNVMNFIPHLDPYKVFSILEVGGVGLRGIFDTRTITNEARNYDGKEFNNSSDRTNALNQNNQVKFWGDPLISPTFFEGGGGSNYGQEALDIMKQTSEYQDAKAKGLLPWWKENMYAQQVAAISDDLLYTGRNRFVRGYAWEADPQYDETQKGKISWLNADGTPKSDEELQQFKPNDWKINSQLKSDYGMSNNGWNSQWVNGEWPNESKRAAVLKTLDVLPTFQKVEDWKNGNNKLSLKQRQWFFSKDKDGNYIYSSGEANSRQESTIINNEMNDDLVTNFSTGNGISFKDFEGNLIEQYPWSNRRLADVQPTYKWDVKQFKDGVYNSDLQNFAQNQISGFYDYYHPYKKGNSISLGKKINMDGSVVGFDAKKDQRILWNIMGANLDKTKMNDKKISFKIQGNISDQTTKLNNSQHIQNLEDMFDIGVVLSDGSFSQDHTETDGLTRYKNLSKFYELKKPDVSIIKDKFDSNWLDVSLDLSQVINPISDNQKLSKIGLVLTPKQDVQNVVFNLGEFSIAKSLKPISSEMLGKISSFNSEYVVERQSTLNARIGWTFEGDRTNLDYYEIYAIDADNKKIRLGETTQEIYYVKNLPFNSNLKIGIKPIYKNYDNKVLGETYIYAISKKPKNWE